ncbi:NADH-quinone oxidoreductase subunit J [Melghirimyces profundicolus]|uniref:NADH-quinone oxidoreductase subunit J n=1 Tax=Melghirimyces profundicolus TaxID=1242148 RepID=A0A2T6C2G6_9BACL|nr:NADH-quinone oxidoreductase subunit J [Melghirimyces profundicolus]PTX62524.1 NADH-quinone oxidoreductase subunit J [Melghirimyces profundicolus]
MIQVSGEFIAFFVVSCFVIGGAVFMIHLVRVVHMVLALAFSLLGIAGIYVLLNAEFLAVVQVLIYTGAVSILMLFGIMLTRHRDREEEGTRLWHSVISFVGVGALFGILIHTIYHTPFAGRTAEVEHYSTARLGETVFKKYVIPFEAVSVLLLVALVGAVILAGKERNT